MPLQLDLSLALWPIRVHAWGLSYIKMRELFSLNQHLVNYFKSFFPPDATNSIERAVKSDEGNYTCEPANLDAPSVRLHVVSGKQRSGDTGLKGGREDSASPARD